jgi:putative transposase
MRGYSALRRGRFSEAGASYFLTICTADLPAGSPLAGEPFAGDERAMAGSQRGLADERNASAIFSEIDRMTFDGAWTLRAATIMPDHLLLLIRLGERLGLSQCIGRLKTKTRQALTRAGLEWQEAFYDHKLSPDDDVQSVVHYVFMNPYRAGLTPAGATWPWFRLGREETQWFAPLYAENVAVPEWLER